MEIKNQCWIFNQEEFDLFVARVVPLWEESGNIGSAVT